jgi:high-affinity iron transporter
MFFNAVVIILQEILEAALMLSLLLSFVRYFNFINVGTVLFQRNWTVFSVVFGVIFAWVYSQNFERISDSFDYVGLEIANATIHSLSCAFLISLAWLFPSSHSVMHLENRLRGATACMVFVVVLAILREGSEIIQFGSGVLGQGEVGLPIFYGGLVGAGIGVSTGVLLYYGLTGLSLERSLKVCVLLLALTAGNMASQATLLLNQADWLPFTPIVWDSNRLLVESSVLGQLAYALIGYEATPSLMQVFAYFFGLVAVFASPISRLAWFGYQASSVRKNQDAMK